MIAIIQNDPEVPAGTYGEALAAGGAACVSISPFRGEPLPSAGSYTAAIVLGGAMGVHDTADYPFLRAVRTFIADCVGRDIPFLGICLGAQLLAEVLGGIVTPSSGQGEKGISTVELTAAGTCDPLFEGIPARFTTFQWHDDSFDLPPGSAHLAASRRCPCQAFRRGNSYGVQFHPEVDREIVSQWAAHEPGEEASRIVSAFTGSIPLYRQASMRLLENFIALASR